MNLLTEAAETCVGRLEALQTFQTTVSAYRADFDALSQSFVTNVANAKQGRKPTTEPMSPSMQDVLQHWNVSILEGGSIEHALWLQKRKAEQDVRRSSKIVDEALRSHLDTLPMYSEQFKEESSGAETDLLKFEQRMQKLRFDMESIDMASTDAEDEAKARFLARWADGS